MATEGEERFLRSSYLLLKGTFFVVKKVLIREAENVHQQTGRDLDGLLKDYEQKLKRKFWNKKQLEILFPPSGKTNVEDWDISLLTGVLLIVFRQSLSNVDRTALTNIQYQRNNVYAHCKVASLDEIDYTDTCNDLEDTFNILASRCGDEVKQECDAIIQTCLNGALDHKSHVELLIQLAEKDNMLVEIIAKIEPIVVGSHLCIWGTDQDQDNIALAENIIVTVTNEAIRRAQTCEENTRIREIIQEILDEITRQTGIKPISAEKSCVIIRFDCCSNEQLFKLIIYMESKDMKERLNKLADSLSRLLNTKEKLQVSFSLSLETLKSILSEITPQVQREYKRSVHIPIQIESVEGIKRVFDLFEGGGLKNNLQKLSEALTEKVGAQINVKPSINMKQLKEALEDFEEIIEKELSISIERKELITCIKTFFHVKDPVEDPARQIGKTEECRSEECATGHKEELYVDAEEGGEQNTQIKLTDHEEDIYVEGEKPEEQSIQGKPSDEKSIQKDDAKDESSEENETVVTLSGRVQCRECLFRLQSVVIDVGTDVLRNIFDQRLQGVALDAFLAKEMENLKSLKQQNVITNAQFNLLYPPGGQPSNIAEFDITLILRLLRYLPSLRSNEFYECINRPLSVTTYKEPNLCRLCEIMDKIVRRSWTGRFQQSFFNTIKTEIEEVLMRLNATVPKPLANLNERIKGYDNKTLDLVAERRHQNIFNQWWEMEYEYVKPQRPPRIKIKKQRKDFWDINPQVTTQNVKKIDMIGGFRSVMEEKHHNEKDVTPQSKDFEFIAADVKSIKTEGHTEELCLDAKEGGEQSIQLKLTGYEEDIYMEREVHVLEEQSIQGKPSVVTLSSHVQYRECLFRLQSLVIDVGTDVLRNIFDQRLQGVALDAFLANEMENLKSLKQQKAITNEQFNMLYPPGGQPSNIAEFDITLILCLLRHLPSLRSNEVYESISWQMLVDVDESVASIEPNIRRLCDIMTEIVHLTRRFQPLYFNTIKTDIEQVLLRLNETVPKPLANLNERIKRCENKTLDPAAEQRNQDIFNQWELQPTPVIHLRPIRTKVPKKMQDFGDINPQLKIQKKKVDSIGGFRSAMRHKQYVKQDVTSMKKDFTSIETDLKSIKTKDIEHEGQKGMKQKALSVK